MPSKVAEKAKKLVDDVSLGYVKEWQKKHPGKPVVGYLPAYAPRELIYAAGGLAVGIWGGGLSVEIIHGDAYYQSYICHLPRSVIELAKMGVYESYQGMIFPSICDVIRNLSGMWKILFPQQWVKYLDLPQNLDPKIGGEFYKRELKHLASLILQKKPNGEYEKALQNAIKSTNDQGKAIRELSWLRSQRPQDIPFDEYYLILRLSLFLPPEEHLLWMKRYMKEVEKRKNPPQDNIRVLLVGAFCEQPPLGLLRTLERAGCYIVNHDLLLGLHWFKEPLDEGGDPWEALVEGYIHKTLSAPFKYQSPEERGEVLLKQIQQHRVHGVIFASPSFCDPSLLERPILMKALQKAGIPYISFKYAENTGQYQPIREQAGTFSDSIRLWGEEEKNA